MRVYYFYHKGKQYYAGTIIKILDKDNTTKEAVFEFCLQKTREYMYRCGERKYLVSEIDFRKMLIEITDQYDSSVKIPIKKYKNDSEISQLVIGWIWYIVIMCITFIFYDRFSMWIMETVVFFTWREKVKEEKGVYYER